MEDVTDASFRYICKKFGASMVYTEFVSSDALVRDVPKSLAKFTIYDYEHPIGIQIYGHMPDAMVDSAVKVEAARPDVIDINFGCPVKKIAGRGAGSGMMREPDKMVEITRRVVEAVHTPVTVKTRLGGTTTPRLSWSWQNGCRTPASPPSPYTAEPAPRCTRERLTGP